MALERAALARLREDLGNDEALFQDIAKTAAQEALGHLAEARAAVRARDAQTLRRAIHSLKSLGRTFGAGELMELALGAEHHAADGKIDAAAAALPRLEKLAAELRADLAALSEPAGPRVAPSYVNDSRHGRFAREEDR